MTVFVDEVRAAIPAPPTTPSQLAEIGGFGSNPGNLRMRLFRPDGSRRKRPLVVVLHGCRQTAESYDRASGWTKLGAAHDFLVLYPEQTEDNNRDKCFSWFQPEDTRRDCGEVASIRQMIARAATDHGADPSRVFVCGLSAGGAMTGAMLAVYPEVFRGGAIIAGLPYGTASNLSEAYESMSEGKIRDPKVWGDFVRAASPSLGPWPSVSIWHGMSDNVVKPINAGELAKQWTNVHGIGANLPGEDHVGKISRRTWYDRKRRPCVVEYSVPGLAHGAPLDDRDKPAPYFVRAGISSTWHIAHDWGLTARRGRGTAKNASKDEPGIARVTAPLAVPVADGAPHRG